MDFGFIFAFKYFPPYRPSKKQFDFILYYFRFESKSEVPRVLSLLASQFTSNEQIEKVNKFVEENKSALGPVDTLQTSLQNANYNLKWAEKNIPVIKKYLKLDSSSAYTTIVSMALSVWLPILAYLCI